MLIGRKTLFGLKKKKKNPINTVVCTNAFFFSNNNKKNPIKLILSNKSLVVAKYNSVVYQDTFLLVLCRKDFKWFWHFGEVEIRTVWDTSPLQGSMHSHSHTQGQLCVDNESLNLATVLFLWGGRKPENTEETVDQSSGSNWSCKDVALSAALLCLMIESEWVKKKTYIKLATLLKGTWQLYERAQTNNISCLWFWPRWK